MTTAGMGVAPKYDAERDSILNFSECLDSAVRNIRNKYENSIGERASSLFSKKVPLALTALDIALGSVIKRDFEYAISSMMVYLQLSKDSFIPNYRYLMNRTNEFAKRFSEVKGDSVEDNLNKLEKSVSLIIDKKPLTSEEFEIFEEFTKFF